MKQMFHFLLLTLPLVANSQPKVALTEASQVSLVTCGPGEELYEAFGHTAIRIYDPSIAFDVVFNYGTFDFNQPNFYWNFVTGRSMYMLATNRYSNFVRAYQYYNRSVREQFLDLTLEQKQNLVDKLMWNSLPENREYLYDYFFDNCSTRPRDILIEALDGQIQFDTTFLPKDRLTIRELTDLYITDEQPWGDLGIDLCLGTHIDQPATAMQYMYLPEKLEEAFDHAYVDRDGERIPIVARKVTTFQAEEVVKEKGWFVPKIVFMVFLLASAVGVTLLRVAGRSTRIFDGSVFMVWSFIGFNGIFLWFFTNHYAADYNWNILWALPTNTIFGYALMKKNRPKWTRHYALFLIVLYVGLLIGWNYLPQLLHHSLKFVVLLQLFLAVGVFRASSQKTAVKAAQS
ncbi:MAG: DUF4105 domain-containing protein [Flavobacteriales bacterium]|nr:DUF4105 domain-containing protein [Flavobacteriales bacterium]MCB9191580.1 DUF4105 domain-containing protein [Flavobacteriales bacterium]MCB9204395.1 DUF4105 domain-containing protein [Flavobacteriales bacterium]